MVPLSRECYIVHDNGFVFGTNFSKMIIIREREAKKDLTSSDEEAGDGLDDLQDEDQGQDNGALTRPGGQDIVTATQARIEVKEEPQS